MLYTAQDDYIHYYNVFDKAIAFKEKIPFENEQNVSDINFFNYEKIMIAAHGDIDCTDYCHKSVFGEVDLTKEERELLTAEELAIFLVELDKNNYFDNCNKISVELVICYAARSNEFKKNHNEIDMNSLNDSFAYKFTNKLKSSLRVPEIKVIAYLGAMSYNPATGFAVCQTEDNIKSFLSLTQEEVQEKVSLEMAANEKDIELDKKSSDLNITKKEAEKLFPKLTEERNELEDKCKKLITQIAVKTTITCIENTGRIAFASPKFKNTISICLANEVNPTNKNNSANKVDLENSSKEEYSIDNCPLFNKR
ncbi:MAG: hypothetical protein LEGION0398_MBIBDBAK_01070 [Legionellaceae bacterium]